MKQEIMRANGSIQHIGYLPQEIRDLYKTVWELSMKDIIDMSRERGYFIDQSQSLNLFMEGATYAKLTSMHFYAWKSGLKTGMYYLRTKSAVDAIKFTVNNEKKNENIPVANIAKPKPVAVEEISVSEYREMMQRAQLSSEDEDCEMCGA